MSSFRSRLVLLENGTQEFLELLVHLGGYCTVEQARRLGVARSPTRVLAQLRTLEKAGFLRRVAAYPLVYQITKSTTRMLGSNSRARRRHAIETIHARLLGVDFYLEASRWPAEFIIEHREKIAAFAAACPITYLPQHGGEPYLRDHFVLWLADGTVAVAIGDQGHRSPFLQLKALLKQFRPLIKHLKAELLLIMAVAGESRHRLYRRLLQHHDLQKLVDFELEGVLRIYRVQQPVRSVPELIWPPQEPEFTKVRAIQPPHRFQASERPELEVVES